jgi:hypothetical protein
VNKDMMVPIDKKRPEVGMRPMLPLWRISTTQI